MPGKGNSPRPQQGIFRVEPGPDGTTLKSRFGSSRAQWEEVWPSRGTGVI